MIWESMDVQAEIDKRRTSDPEFRKAWDDSRMEYRLLSELIKLRKENGMSQTELAEKTGSNQRVISRIENHEQSPTLKTLCNWANALNADVQIIRRA